MTTMQQVPHTTRARVGSSSTPVKDVNNTTSTMPIRVTTTSPAVTTTTPTIATMTSPKHTSKAPVVVSSRRTTTKNNILKTSAAAPPIKIPNNSAPSKTSTVEMAVVNEFVRDILNNYYHRKINLTGSMIKTKCIFIYKNISFICRFKEINLKIEVFDAHLVLKIL